MKIRNGFVSNSSSSSFMVLGFKPSDDDLLLLAQYYGYNQNLDLEDEYELREEVLDYIYDNLNRRDVYMIHEPTLIGYLIADGNEYIFDKTETSFNRLDEMYKELKILFPDKEIKIFTGERAC